MIWPYKHTKNIPLATLILNIWVHVTNFNCSNVNQGYSGVPTDEQMDYSHFIVWIDRRTF